MKNKILLSTLCVFALCAASATASTYIERDGIVAMEMENTPSSLGMWSFVTAGSSTNYPAGATGTGHLEFTGNTTSGGSPNSPVTYTFKIKQTGTYNLTLRAFKRLEGLEGDKCNDCWIRMAGNFTSGNPFVPLSELTNDTKIFGGWSNGWGPATQLDSTLAHLEPAVYNFIAGETYTLTISGRSQRFNIDRIVFNDPTMVEVDWTNLGSFPESEVWESGDPEAFAGEDLEITLPVSEIDINGYATDDVGITSSLWTQTYGPNTAVLTDAATTNLTASGLIEGTYIFRLTVMDGAGNSTYDNVSVVVNPEIRIPVIASIGMDGGMLSMGVSNGENDGFFDLLSTTNLQDSGSWTVVQSNLQFTAAGEAIVSNNAALPFAYFKVVPGADPSLITATFDWSDVIEQGWWLNYNYSEEDNGITMLAGGRSAASNNGTVQNAIKAAYSQDSDPGTFAIQIDGIYQDFTVTSIDVQANSNGGEISPSVQGYLDGALVWTLPLIDDQSWHTYTSGMPGSIDQIVWTTGVSAVPDSVYNNAIDNLTVTVSTDD